LLEIDHCGALTITGMAEHLEVRRNAEPSLVDLVDADVGAP